MGFKYNSNLDYFSSMERRVASVLKRAGIRFRHGIAVDPERGLEAIRLSERVLYVPDFILPDFPLLFVECKDFNCGSELTDWARKFELLKMHLKIVLIIPDDSQAFQAETLCTAYVTKDRIDELPYTILNLSIQKQVHCNPGIW
jgi:hypothetical protein